MKLDLIDTHCHLDMDRFDGDREEVIQRAIAAGVRRVIVPGLDIATSRAAIELSEGYPGIYAAVGYHPNSLEEAPNVEPTLKTLSDLARHPKVVAIGEIGLDYYWNKTSKEIQREWLRAQLEMASDLELPVILHNRESTADILNILEDWTKSDLPVALRDRPGVMHSFSGKWDDAEATFRMNFWIGFTGPLTFKKAEELRNIAEQAPAEKILLETDAPFLAPHPFRGKRNEPSYLAHTAQALADVRGESLEDIAASTTRNAETLFRFALAS